MPDTPNSIRQQIDDLYRTDSRRVFATLVRLLSDFDRAEEATQNAFAAAIEQWPAEGLPTNPYAWLVSTGRFGAIDAARRRAQFKAALPLIAAERPANAPLDSDEIEDDRLRLIFTCCHPALSPPLQIALTLREVCDLTTEEIASAFLEKPSAIAQHIVRGKSKIRLANIPYAIPSRADIPQRLESVLSVIYLVFTEGYSASSGNTLTRSDLSAEAIRLARLLVQLLPAPPDAEALGLLALLLFQDSRRSARTSPTGDIILLEDQNRSLWNQPQITEAIALVEQAFASPSVGPYAIQAAIASVHARAPRASETNWPQLVSFYDLLLQANPSPIIELNRAVALAMRDGPQSGLDAIDAILARNELTDYHLAHAARADFLRRLNKTPDARESYERALSLCRQEPERRFLERRLRELG